MRRSTLLISNNSWTGLGWRLWREWIHPEVNQESLTTSGDGSASTRMKGGAFLPSMDLTLVWSCTGADLNPPQATCDWGVCSCGWSCETTEGVCDSTQVSFLWIWAEMVFQLLPLLCLRRLNKLHLGHWENWNILHGVARGPGGAASLKASSSFESGSSSSSIPCFCPSSPSLIHSFSNHISLSGLVMALLISALQFNSTLTFSFDHIFVDFLFPVPWTRLGGWKMFFLWSGFSPTV